MISKNTPKYKTKETAKQELLNRLMDNVEIEELWSKEIANGITDPRDTIKMIKRYEEIIKTQNKKVINIVRNQGQLLKKFKSNEKIFFN